jgi:dipeptidase D
MPTPTDSLLATLAPSSVWAHFATLCRIPRPSKHEAALRDHLLQWARDRADSHGLRAEVDAAGNLIIRKPGTPGLEAAPMLALQGHLDMVTQKQDGSTHDFMRDPIQAVLQDGWLRAPDTTLGSDNGIGVALSLALLESTDVPHGPLEALFTVDEEAGMGGAHGLAPGSLQAKLMLNLDTEEWGEFYLGCAGGLDVDVHRSHAPQAWPAGLLPVRLKVSGLRGGHSGVNIHEERGNAIKLLVQLLNALSLGEPSTGVPAVAPGLRLARLQGGSARNALPREAEALLAVPAAEWPALQAALPAWGTRWQALLLGVEPVVRVQADVLAADEAASCVAAGVLPVPDQATWLRSLHASPHGVRRVSQRVQGVVETSNNLGLIDITPPAGHANFMLRSLRDDGSRALADELVSLWSLSGTSVSCSGDYPGWTPNPDSPLLATCQRVYKQRFQADSHVQVIHAGLECGILAAKHPGLDIVSFGPTIRGAHAPGEAVEVASVGHCWTLLKDIALAVAQGGV